jgi:hypothetical protein
MAMTRLLFIVVVLSTVAVIAAVYPPPLLAQTNSVEIQLNLGGYDILYLNDFLGVSSEEFFCQIPDISGEMRTTPPGRTVQLYLRLNVLIRFTGESRTEELFLGGAVTNDFELVGERRFTGRDFCGGPSGAIRIVTYRENTRLTERIEEHARKFPTAPVGHYTVVIEAFSASNRGLKLGGTKATITVQFSSPGEVVVELLDPQAGSSAPTQFPTFSWSSQSRDMRLFVYEQLPSHRSPQEAITGIPHLKADLSGVNTYTYPKDAPRRLELNKSYYWFVEAVFSSNRGAENRRSEIRMFRIGLRDPLLQLLNRVTSERGGTAADTYAALAQLGWTPTETGRLDGKPLRRNQLTDLLNTLAGKGFSLRVESR